MGILKGFRRLVMTLMSRMDFSVNLSPFNTTVSKKVICEGFDNATQLGVCAGLSLFIPLLNHHRKEKSRDF